MDGHQRTRHSFCPGQTGVSQLAVSGLQRYREKLSNLGDFNFFLERGDERSLSDEAFIDREKIANQDRHGRATCEPRETVLEGAAKEVIGLVEANRDVGNSKAEPLPEWMTAAQLARYWQLVNTNDEPITAGNEVDQAC